ncbi:MAG: leucyl aminopeptidase [Ignavibacteria bacterium]|nr:leucyl aminopeptidase [Ignavibacteria bacterium]
MKITFDKSPANKIKSDAFVFLCYEDKDLLTAELKNIETTLNTEILGITLEDFSGRDTEVEIIYSNDKRIILSGLGKKDELTLEKVRKACARAVKKANDYKIEKVAVEIVQDESLKRTIDVIAKVQTEACIMALYAFDKYITTAKEKRITIEEITFFSEFNNLKKFAKQIEEGIKVGSIIGKAVHCARDLGNEPSNVLYPEELANRIKKLGKQRGYAVRAFGMNELQKMGMGGIIAIGKGSKNGPYLIEMKYNGGKKGDAPVVVVGKGVTFDSGGISIKPSAGMEAMKMDMCGAAAVVGVFEAVTQLKLKVNLVGLIPSVENMPGGNAIKPGDIIKSYSGKTIEVGNTDAEGRVILADAITYGSRMKPNCIIDLATLTGATVVALGHFVTTAMTNNSDLKNEIIESGQATYERVWELPTWMEYDKLIDCDNADVSNMGNPARTAGTIVGGMFLKRFVENCPWVHLDIAGTAMSNSTGDYIPKYATGVGVRLITHFLRKRYS